MPRYVDHKQRQLEIVQAAARVLAEKGLRGLTIRAVAEEMGGSATLVTHYFSTRRSLLQYIAEPARAEWTEQLAEIAEESSDPRDRLRAVMIWSLSLDNRVEERAWLSLLTAPAEDRASVATLHDKMGELLLDIFESTLEGQVEPNHLAATASLLRSVAKGMIVCSEESPKDWPRDQQIAVIDRLLDLLPLLIPGEAK